MIGLPELTAQRYSLPQYHFCQVSATALFRLFLSTNAIHKLSNSILLFPGA